MDQKTCIDAIEKFNKVYYNTSNIKEEYLQFSRFIQGIFISKNGWIIDTGNYQTVNRVLMEDVYNKIQKHPLLWKIFFMIA